MKTLWTRSRSISQRLRISSKSPTHLERQMQNALCYMDILEGLYTSQWIFIFYFVVRFREKSLVFNLKIWAFFTTFTSTVKTKFTANLPSSKGWCMDCFKCKNFLQKQLNLDLCTIINMVFLGKGGFRGQFHVNLFIADIYFFMPQALEAALRLWPRWLPS